MEEEEEEQAVAEEEEQAVLYGSKLRLLPHSELLRQPEGRAQLQGPGEIKELD